MDMKDWRGWLAILAITLVLSGAWLVSTRYSLECVRGRDGGRGTTASGVYCYVLDGWSGEVR